MEILDTTNLVNGNANDDKEFFSLCESNKPEALIKYINNSTKSVDLNRQQKDTGKTLLHMAVELENYYITQYLLTSRDGLKVPDLKVDIGINDSNGENPFHVACRKYDIGIIRLFIKTIYKYPQYLSAPFEPFAFSKNNKTVLNIFCHMYN